MSLCTATANHQPMGHPWSLAAQCTKPEGHEHGDTNQERVHRDRVEGYTILWRTTDLV